MSQSISYLQLDSITIRQRDGLFSLNDLHKASGDNPNQRPGEFIRNQQTRELIAELSNAGISAIETKRGGNGGTYACRELVIAYAAWISAAFHLKVIRVFLGASAQPQPARYAVQPTDQLTGPQQTELRTFLEDAAAKLPLSKRGAFLASGWAKLKKHTGVPYRQIPQHQHADALSLLARHAVEWDLVDAAPAARLPVPKSPTTISVDRMQLASIYTDLGRLRKRIDALGMAGEDLPPSWWREQAISQH